LLIHTQARTGGRLSRCPLTVARPGNTEYAERSWCTPWRTPGRTPSGRGTGRPAGGL